jgi:hypothetical protein
MCLNCGFYNGKMVVDMKAKREAREARMKAKREAIRGITESESSTETK